MDAPDIERSRKQPSKLLPNVLIEPHLSFSLPPGAAHSLFWKKRMGGAFPAPNRWPSRAGLDAGTHHKGPLPPAPIIHLPKDAFPAPKSNPPACGALRTHTPSRHCDSRAFHARQSRRFLESGSLAPQLAALRTHTPSRHCDSRASHARQSRRFLETSSLFLPLAALRLFPQPPGAAKSNSMR